MIVAFISVPVNMVAPRLCKPHAQTGFYAAQTVFWRWSQSSLFEPWFFFLNFQMWRIQFNNESCKKLFHWFFLTIKATILAKHGISGVSNSVSYAGHILTKKRLAGHIKRKNVSTGCNRRLKVPLYYNNRSFSNNLSNFNDVPGHINTSSGPHAARGPRVWDPCGTSYLRHGQKF